MKTFVERLISALIKRGYVEDKLDKSRYRAFTRTDHPNKVFVGQAGALRVGPCASHSYSVGDPQNQTAVYKKLLSESAATP